MQTRPPAAKPPYATTYLPLSSYPVSPCFPFFPMIVLHCISEHEVQTKNRPWAGKKKKRAATTFCAAPMTPLLQGASFTVGLINSDRREILGLLWLLCFAEIKEMIARDLNNHNGIFQWRPSVHLSLCISCACLTGTLDSYWTGGNEDSEQFHNNLVRRSRLSGNVCYFSEFT